MNTKDKVEWCKPPVRVNQCHKIQGYDHHDKIEIPVLFGLTKECGRVYDLETMTEYLNYILNSIEEHEKLYKNI